MFLLPDYNHTISIVDFPQQSFPSFNHSIENSLEKELDVIQGFTELSNIKIIF